MEFAKVESSSNGVTFDEIWCVFDRDDHEKIDEAINMAKDNGILVAFSNPNFELWFLKHYADQTGYIDRKSVIQKLKRYMPGYTKAARDIYEKLAVLQQDAIIRVRKLRKYHRDNQEPVTRNPSTNVDKLVSSLENIKIL